MRLHSLIKMFDNVVLDVICKQIYDPLTYFNFSLVNKKCHRIAMLNRESKLDGFTREIEEGTYYKTVFPNGMMHGFSIDPFYLMLYYFGHMVARRRITKIIEDIIIIRCNCPSISDTEILNKYQAKNRFLLPPEFTENNFTFTCRTCGSKERRSIYMSQELAKIAYCLGHKQFEKFLI